MRPHQRGHASSHLTHWRQQRQGVVAQAYCFVRDRHVLGFHQRVGAFPRRGQVQVSEEHLVLSSRKAVILLADRFFHLQDELTVAPHIVGVLDNGCSVSDVVSVTNGRTDTRTALYQNLVPRARELSRARRGQGDPVLVLLNFLRYSDDHGRSSFQLVVLELECFVGPRSANSLKTRCCA